jgi:hypothetical protein
VGSSTKTNTNKQTNKQIRIFFLGLFDYDEAFTTILQKEGEYVGHLQKFCTLYVFFLKMNLFYKMHLEAFNVISIVLYHSGPTFGQVFYSCQDVFVVDASDYSGHLIRHLLLQNIYRLSM